MTPIEVQEAAAIIEGLCDPDVNLVWGMTLDESYDDEVKVTVIATGFASYEENTSLKRPQRDDLGRKTQTGSFISRAMESTQPAQEAPVQEEDYETPAFMKKRF